MGIPGRQKNVGTVYTAARRQPARCDDASFYEKRFLGVLRCAFAAQLPSCGCCEVGKPTEGLAWLHYIRGKSQSTSNELLS